jgi:hypothetical protein
VESLIRDSAESAVDSGLRASHALRAAHFDSTTVHNLYDTAQYDTCKIDSKVVLPAGFTFKLPPLSLSRVTFPRDKTVKDSVEASIKNSVRAKDLFRRSGDGGLAYEFDMMQVHGYSLARQSKTLPELSSHKFRAYMNAVVVEDMNRSHTAADNTGPFQKMIDGIESIMDELPDNVVCAPRASIPIPVLDTEFSQSNDDTHTPGRAAPQTSADILAHLLKTETCLTALWNSCSEKLQNQAAGIVFGNQTEDFFEHYTNKKCDLCWDEFFNADLKGDCINFVAQQFVENSDQQQALRHSEYQANEYATAVPCKSKDQMAYDTLDVRDLVCIAKRKMCASFDDSIASHMNENFMYPNFLGKVQKEKYAVGIGSFTDSDTKRMISSVYRGSFLAAECEASGECAAPKLDSRYMPLRSAGWVVADSMRDKTALTTDNTKLKLTRGAIGSFLANSLPEHISIANKRVVAHCLRHLPRPAWSMMLPGTYNTVFMTETCPLGASRELVKLPGAAANTRKQRRRVWAYFRPQSTGQYSFKLLGAQSIFALSRDVRLRISKKIPDAYTKIGGRTSWMFGESAAYLDGESYATQPSSTLFDMETLIKYSHFSDTRSVCESAGHDDKAMFRDYLDPLNDYHRYWCTRELGLGSAYSQNWFLVKILCYGAEPEFGSFFPFENVSRWNAVSTDSSGSFSDENNTDSSTDGGMGDHIVESHLSSGFTRCGKGSKLRHVTPPDKTLIGTKTRELFELVQLHANVAHTDGCDFGDDRPGCGDTVTIRAPKRLRYIKEELVPTVHTILYNTTQHSVLRDNFNLGCTFSNLSYMFAIEANDTDGNPCLQSLGPRTEGNYVGKPDPLTAPQYATIYNQSVAVYNQSTNTTVMVEQRVERYDLVYMKIEYKTMQNVTYYRSYDENCTDHYKTLNTSSQEGRCAELSGHGTVMNGTMTAEECYDSRGNCVQNEGQNSTASIQSKVTCIDGAYFYTIMKFLPTKCNGKAWDGTIAECHASVGTCGPVPANSSLLQTTCNGDKYTDTPGNCVGTYVANWTSRAICESNYPKTCTSKPHELVPQNVSYSKSKHQKQISNYLAAHLPSQDLYLEASKPVQLALEEIYKVELSFEYFGANSLTDLSFVPDHRFQAGTFESDLYDPAVKSAAKALVSDEAQAAYGFDIRASFLGSVGDKKPFQYKKVAYALNERICTRNSMSKDFTNDFNNMRFSRYETAVVKILPSIEFPNAGTPGQRPGTYYGMQSSAYPPIIP